jgi:Tfp pilus assembly protein PilP
MKRSLTLEVSTVVMLSGAALLFGAPPVRAQINPQTAKGIAQSGAKAAQDANASAPQQAPAQKPATAAQKTVNTPQKPAVTKPVTQKSTAPAAKPGTATDAQKTAKKTDATKPAARVATKSAVTSTPKATDKAEPKKAAAAVEKPHSEEPEHVAYRRDPFSYLVGKNNNSMGSTVVLPPGKAGLQVESLLIQGIVSSPEGMIAVVANPQQRVYFLREGDQLFDGSVVKIGLEAITFHEVGHDAFGKATEREVTKRLNNSSGELP